MKPLIGNNDISESAIEKFLHRYHCRQNIEDALSILANIEKEPEHVLALPAFGYAIIQYSRCYKVSYAMSQRKLFLNKLYVPKAFAQLHEEIINDRDQLHAHSDLRVFEPRLYSINESYGMTFTTFSQNLIFPFDKLDRLREIKSLLQGTHEKISNVIAHMERIIIHRKAQNEAATQ